MRTSMSTDLGWEEAVHATLQEEHFPRSPEKRHCSFCPEGNI